MAQFVANCEIESIFGDGCCYHFSLVPEEKHPSFLCHFDINLSLTCYKCHIEREKRTRSE